MNMGFDEILGHQDLKERLGRAAVGDRVGSAYLFLGPDGVGRRLVATAWAALLNCEEPAHEYPFACGRCRPCRLIGAGQYPDVVLVQAAEGKDLKIEAIRTLLKEAHYRPYEGRKRVFIVDNADHMTAGAANALLKTLEEPAETLVMVLIAESEGMVLPTIRSRCQLVRFGTLPTDAIVERLRGEGVSDEEAVRHALEASGSLGGALKSVREGEERNAVRNEVIEYLGNLGREPLAPFRMAERFRDAAVPALQVVKGVYRDALVFRTRGTENGIMNRGSIDLLEHIAARLDPRELADRFLAIESAERRIHDFHANKQLVLETLFQTLAE